MGVPFESESQRAAWERLRGPLEELKEVKAAYLEGNGEITVLKVKTASS